MLEIDSETLSDFVIDFLHHMSYVKTFIYNSIENDDITSVQNAVFMVKGLCFNLRIMDIYNLLEKIENKQYNEVAELLKDVNSVYQKVEILSQKVVNGGKALQFQDVELRENIVELNNSSLPNFVFQNLVNSFIKLYDSSKDKIEESINPEKIKEVKHLFKEMLNLALSLNIKELIEPLNSILKQISSKDIEFDEIVINWIELSNYIDNLR